ncbi:MAG: nucleoside phosphorylase [Bacteroidales bacterium]|jgi:uridine phosphorylase|nr:nucleoside phosphorylase [Bacteroidales bacterium]MBR6279446.1 nucleoside phosphorylase [Bacteroidales bacterium]
MKPIEDSELIINGDGSIFHLHLKPEDIADNIILVGDQNRTDVVAKFFDTTELTVQNREFRTVTGYKNGKRITVVSTGIGTDNIDIVLTELDALANIDFKTRLPKEEHKTLNIVRIGTCGSLQADIPVGEPVVTAIAGGLDGLLNFYKDRNKVCDLELERLFQEHTKRSELLARPYFVESSPEILKKLSKFRQGITLSAPGFYGPQGRVVRLGIIDEDINSKIETFEYKGLKVNNYEMESSAINGLGRLLGHNTATVCLVIANRRCHKFADGYRNAMPNLVEQVIDVLTK